MLGHGRKVEFQAVGGVLVDHPQHRMPELAPHLVRSLPDIRAAGLVGAEKQPPGGRHLVEVQTLHQGRLSAARFADNAQDLVGTNVERDLVEGMNGSAVDAMVGPRVAGTAALGTLGPENPRQSLDPHQRFFHTAPRVCWS